MLVVGVDAVDADSDEDFEAEGFRYGSSHESGGSNIRPLIEVVFLKAPPRTAVHIPVDRVLVHPAPSSHHSASLDPD